MKLIKFISILFIFGLLSALCSDLSISKITNHRQNGFQISQNDKLGNFKSNLLIHSQEVDKADVIKFGDKVLLQPYYFLMPDEGWLYNQLNDLMPYFSEIGFDAIWLPPVVKTLEGDIARFGYEPYDYYDLGEFNQGGSIETRYGSRNELEQMIQSANELNIGVINDVVINHRVGLWEFNPYVNAQTRTNFMNVSSGKLKMNYTHFWPNAYGNGDNGVYGALPDMSHKHPYVQEELIKYAKWLRDEIGFDGFRFDSSQFINPTMLRSWMQNTTDTWGAAEYWIREPDLGMNEILTYLDETNNTVSTFDFALLTYLQGLTNFDGAYDLRNLVGAGISGKRPNQAVTFAVNHDTYRDQFNIFSNRELAYAYILTHYGYPSIFWMDLLDLNLFNHLKTLIKIHNQYALGELSILFADEDLYVAQRGGEPGIILVLNDNPTEEKQVTVSSKFLNVILNDLTGQSPSANADINGLVTLTVRPSSYAVFSDQEPLADLDKVTNYGNFESSFQIKQGSFKIDGILDDDVGIPLFIDQIGDALTFPFDLTNLYTKYDDSNLYISFGFYNLNTWGQGIIEFGIALDTKLGGSSEGPGVHQKIKWGGSGSSKKPDYIYYIETTKEKEDYKREISTFTEYKYDGNSWNQGTELSLQNIKSGDMLGLIELAIPLNQLEFDQSPSLGIKVFSTLNGFDGAKDSVPQDNSLDISGESDSWLFMPNPMTIEIISPSISTIISSSHSQTTSLQSTNDSTSLKFWVLPILVVLTNKNKK